MAPRPSALAAAAAAAVAACTAAQPTASFMAPVPGMYAANADMQPAVNVSSADQCASICLGLPACVSFNLCQSGSGFACGVSGWNISYVSASSSACSWYRRITPRDDTPSVQAVPWLLAVPTANVSVTNGPISDGFFDNLNLYLKVRDPLDMLFFFAQRAGNANPPGQCFGWDEWIKGSATGNYLMGVGGALRWIDDPQLRSNAETVVSGIGQYAQPDGWIWAFNESDIGADNLPDYCASWVTRGLLDVHGAGVQGALELARTSISYFNNHSQLPFFLPPNGGPDPVQPYPSGFNNVTAGGYGQAYGHMIYIQFQGMIKHTLMALSEAGTQADINLIADHYQEDWWLAALLAKDAYHGVWHRQFFSHNYEVTAYEAFLDMYVLTGNGTYLQAMQNAWEMLREHWILPGGSMAINEYYYYPPDSYFIGFTGINVASAGGHNHHVHSHSHGAEEEWEHEEHGHEVTSSDPYYHAPCMPSPGLDQPSTIAALSLAGNDPATGANSSAAVAPAALGQGATGGDGYMSPLLRLKLPAMEPDATAVGGPNDKDPPTGELCGSVFWTKFNQRFHRLFPDNETYVWEMERSILNVGLAALGQPGSGGQGPGGTGIRYFANQHKQKQNPSMHASCCEGQGTRLFGSLPEYIYTLLPASSTTASGQPKKDKDLLNAGVAGVYVDLYAGSNISFPLPSGAAATLVQTTAWPYDTAVTLTLTMPAAATLDLALRMPAWVAAASVPITVNGAAWPIAGTPGSYLHLKQSWPAGVTTITYDLPMAFAAHYYNGSSQLPPYSRWGYTYGPILLAGEGPWNSTVDGLVMPTATAGLDPANPAKWMVPVPPPAEGRATTAATGAGGATVAQLLPPGAAGLSGPTTLHFNVAGAPGYSFKPYLEVQDANEMFTVYPCF